MKFRSIWLSLVLAVFAALPGAANAHCRLPDSATASPRAAARWVLDNSDIVGFAIVRQRENAAAGQAEAIDLIFPMKGPSGLVSMRLERANGAVLITNSTTTFGVEPGTVVFAALNVTPRGAVVSECKALLFSRVPRDRIISALWEMWRARELPRAGRR